MKTVEKICEVCYESFLADPREIKRGNAKYCSLSCSAKNPRKNIKKFNRNCIYCGNSFLSRCSDSKYCSSICKQRNYRKNSKSVLSIKSFYNILGFLPCELCGWTESVRDIHHIIPVSKGGKNEINNLIVVCPNHHRMIHNNLVSEEAILKALNFRLSLHPELYPGAGRSSW